MRGGENWGKGVGMIILKGCPRCRGDVQINKDFYGKYRECLQCGYMEDLEEKSSASESTAARPASRAA